jgi:hypothetical protein
VSNGQVLFVGDDYQFYQLDHMGWQEYLQHLEPKVHEGANWIDLFQKCLQIYKGQIKGLLNLPEEE